MRPSVPPYRYSMSPVPTKVRHQICDFWPNQHLVRFYIQPTPPPLKKHLDKKIFKNIYSLQLRFKRYHISTCKTNFQNLKRKVLLGYLLVSKANDKWLRQSNQKMLLYFKRIVEVAFLLSMGKNGRWQWENLRVSNEEKEFCKSNDTEYRETGSFQHMTLYFYSEF